MNMKKSIAGVMAGAMAVSAMATTASAWTGGDATQGTIVLSYDLRAKKSATADSKVTVTYKYNTNSDGYKIIATATGSDGEQHMLGHGGVDTVDVQMGARLVGYQGSGDYGIKYYNLDSVKISATSTQQTDATGGTFTASDTYTFSTKNTVGSDSTNETVYLDSNQSVTDEDNGCVYAYNIPFTITTSNKNAFNVRSYKIDSGTETSDGTYEWVKTGKSAVTYDTEFEANGALQDHQGEGFTQVVAKTVSKVYATMESVAVAGTSAKTFTTDNTTTILNSGDLFTEQAAAKQAADADKATSDNANKYDYYIITFVDTGSSEAEYADGEAAADATVDTNTDGTAMDVAYSAGDAGYAVAKVEKTVADIPAGAVTAKIELENVTGDPEKYTLTDAEYWQLKRAYDEALNAYNASGISIPYDTATVGVVSDPDVTVNWIITDDTGKYAYGAYEYTKVTDSSTWTDYGFKTYTIVLEYSVNAQGWDGDWYLVLGETWSFDTASAGIVGIGDVSPSVNQNVQTPVDYYMPLRTDASEPANVIARLTDNGYTYPLAVLNDVVANNENVAFTFTTSQSYVDNRKWVKAVATYGGNGVTTFDRATVTNPAGGNTTFELNTKTSTVYETQGTLMYRLVGSTVYVENPYYGVAYSANKNDDYNGTTDSLWYNPYFTQDLYQSWTWGGSNGYYVYGPNGSQTATSVFGSYAANWNKNLLAAGLVVNSAWSMQLNQTTGLEWGDTTVTFFWDDITADDNVTNFSDVITSMQLITPTEWFWDSLAVEVGAAISVDASAGAGLEEDAETVTEAEVEEDVIVEEEEEEEQYEDDYDYDDFDEEFEDFEDFEDEEEEYEDFEDEEEAEDVTEAETESAEEQAPPKTGNAPVALAVIPVALAAAAVIAKKKN